MLKAVLIGIGVTLFFMLLGGVVETFGLTIGDRSVVRVLAFFMVFGPVVAVAAALMRSGRKYYLAGEPRRR